MTAAIVRPLESRDPGIDGRPRTCDTPTVQPIDERDPREVGDRRAPTCAAIGGSIQARRTGARAFAFGQRPRVRRAHDVDLSDAAVGWPARRPTPPTVGCQLQ